MGLDVSHDCWHGAYSAFSRWRNAIAEAGGYLVAKITMPDGYDSTTVLVDWGHLGTKDRLFGEWGDYVADDPLIYLIVHSDCEGSLHPKQAAPLADALEALLPKLDGNLGGHIGVLREKTETFIAGLRKAVAANETVEFH